MAGRGTASLLESPLSGQPAGFQNVVIPAQPVTDGGTITMFLASNAQWFGELTNQQVFGAIADATPTGDIYVDIEGLGPKPVYAGAAIANGVIAGGDYFQIAYNQALLPDGGFHLLNWSQGQGTSFVLTTVGTSGPATFVGGILNIPEYSVVGETVVVTGAGPVVVLADDGLIILNKLAPSPTSIQLPDVSLRNGLPLTIVDYAGNAGDITILPSGVETIMGLASATLVSNGQGVGLAASITLVPSVDIDGWIQN